MAKSVLNKKVEKFNLLKRLHLFFSRCKLLTLSSYLLTLSLLISCSSGRGKSDEGSVSTVLPDEITEVSVMRLELTDFYNELHANGIVSALNRADLRFQLSENIAAIYVKNGDRVTKGQKIAMLDQFKLQIALSQAKDNLERAKLDLQDVLIGQGYLLSDSARIPADVMQLAKVRSNYDNSINQRTLAEYNLKNSILYAPFDGIVASLFSKVFNLPDGSQPFCTIIDNLHPEINFKVLENELPYLRVGDKIRVSPFSANDYSYEGQIVEINPSIDKNGMAMVKAQINNPQNQLYDGMNVNINLLRSLGKQLVIPKEALVLRTNRKVVFTLKNGHAQWVYVQTSLENSSSYVVTENLTPGDSVIYEGNINLAHESPVRVKNVNSPTAPGITETVTTKMQVLESVSEPPAANSSNPETLPPVTTATSRPTNANVLQTNTASANNNVLAKVRIEPGQRLTLIAEKYYGLKVFWVYIYEHNKAVIGSDPGRISVGMEITVPAKEVYGIDANNASSVEKATALQQRIMSVY